MTDTLMAALPSRTMPLSSLFSRLFSRRLLLLGPLAAFAPVATGGARGEMPDVKTTAVFVHAGGEPEPGLGRKAAALLARRGFVVRSVDQQQDRVGGPGVDYFYDGDATTAAQIAAAINDGLGKALPAPLAPRRQRVKASVGIIGIWLFPAK